RRLTGSAQVGGAPQSDRCLPRTGAPGGAAAPPSFGPALLAVDVPAPGRLFGRADGDARGGRTHPGAFARRRARAESSPAPDPPSGPRVPGKTKTSEEARDGLKAGDGFSE